VPDTGFARCGQLPRCPAMISTTGPDAPRGRRGRRTWWTAATLAAGALGLGTGLLLASCAGLRPTTCGDLSAVLYAQPVDSLGLAAFDSLDASAVQDRRRRAGVWRFRLGEKEPVVQQLHALHQVVGLVPDEPEPWLRLVELRRLLGDREGAQSALHSALAAIRQVTPQEQPGLRLRVALLQAWLHYDMGEWQQGGAWVEQAVAFEPADRRTLLIHGLMLAGAERSRDATWLASEIERLDFFWSDWRWVRGMAEFYQRRYKEAVHQLAGVRPAFLHRPDFWRDLGLAYEGLADWRQARRAYRDAQHALPSPVRDCLRLEERHPPAAPAGAPLLPCWLAFDRTFASGSPTAFALLAEERFQAATDQAAREWWAESAVAAASILVRKQLHVTWARALRGRIYAQIDMPDLARPDLEKAVAGYQAQGRIDPPTFYWAGHLLLKEEKYAAARPLLAAVVAVDSTHALAWSDLGLALIMTADPTEAEAALNHALALDPELAVAWYNRGLLHFHHEQWPEAVHDLERAAQLAPDSAEIAQILQRARLLAAREQRPSTPRTP
jgi:tetratricopeptide (TPR) repeat protein